MEFITVFFVSILKYLLYILEIAFALGVVVFIHELGHFLVARGFKVGIERFSLGFGPRLVGKQVGITDYRISYVPLGGYVKMVGEEPNADIPEEKIPMSFTHRPVHQRFLIVAAGPVFNLLLAIIIFAGIFMMKGAYVPSTTIGKVNENTPASEAGLQKGDKIVAIDGKSIDNWFDMADMISASKGRELEIKINRDGTLKTFQIAPQKMTTKNILGEDIERHVIGITRSDEGKYESLGVFEAIKTGFVRTYEMIRLIIIVIGKLFTGAISYKTLGGPIQIAQESVRTAEQGAAEYIFWIAFLSVNLGIMNFLPIPVLDGGHLMFYTIEAVIRRPLNTRMREVAQQLGILILLLLMILIFYNDITRILSS